ncbi:MAG: LytTR family DNA-binding domain-containing protein [candidate division KSB1 bacterium]|nr:LytTR family DNA-binding domain-containing protein [candidate division KSB1 bacterium]MDZ7273527.1 LytTR family DNA-binding domain-containing protein [candidate division KSB1 bacterium]MDZ7286882.1 LytTR family DNA-binding domain-containing protein [candidate division KSB1 bacterium]MDZ7299765.1 LytTR family DNA-binding domain-containing protein [candidate division KSB1 bacterium]MDZ7308490.1 LytTR family DNA-binding domain-containing protein [candidate division KSB1 bacterium]
MQSFRTIIVDDEWLVRAELKMMLADHPEIVVIGEAGSVAQAVALMENSPPDVIFLDIQLPGASGFDLLDQVETSARIIFVTAYDKYALRAFEVNALDYLLKPISRERLAKAIKKLGSNEPAPPQPGKRAAYDDVLYVIVNGALKFIKLPLLKCITAEGNYSWIYYADKPRALVSKTLQEWDELLPEKHFVRIHRSAIVNFDYVEQVKKCRNYTQEVFIQGLPKPFIMSRRYASRLKHLLPI